MGDLRTVMKNMLNDFEKEQDELLKFVLDERFFKVWKTPEDKTAEELSLWGDTSLELYLTSTCNQKCEYCYLVKYDLYPREYDKPEIIMKNLEIVYNWILDNNYYIRETEFFSGEIWHTKFGLDVLELTYQYLQKGMRIGAFVIPSNCSFVLDTVQTQKIQKYIDKFNALGHPLCFSLSVDGLIIDNEERPLNNGTVRTEDYYENLFMFAYHNHFYFHPMLSAHSVSKWIENYKWWMKKLEEYEFPPDAVMILEVRNNEWTEENLKDFANFLNFLIDENIKRHNGDIESYIMSYFDGDYSLSNIVSGYTPVNMAAAELYPPCTIAQALTIRMGDLAICPCHRTAYNKLLYGWFKTENDKIVGIKQNNVYNAIRVLLTNHRAGHIKCDTCIYASHCLQGCMGCQFENNNDMFMPIENICELNKVKWQTIIKKLQEVGALDVLKKINAYQTSYRRAVDFLTFAQEVLNDVG